MYALGIYVDGTAAKRALGHKFKGDAAKLAADQALLDGAWHVLGLFIVQVHLVHVFMRGMQASMYPTRQPSALCELVPVRAVPNTQQQPVTTTHHGSQGSCCERVPAAVSVSLSGLLESLTQVILLGHSDILKSKTCRGGEERVSGQVAAAGHLIRSPQEAAVPGGTGGAAGTCTEQGLPRELSQSARHARHAVFDDLLSAIFHTCACSPVRML